MENEEGSIELSVVPGVMVGVADKELFIPYSVVPEIVEMLGTVKEEMSKG